MDSAVSALEETKHSYKRDSFAFAVAVALAVAVAFAFAVAVAVTDTFRMGGDHESYKGL